MKEFYLTFEAYFEIEVHYVLLFDFSKIMWLEIDLNFLEFANRSLIYLLLILGINLLNVEKALFLTFFHRLLDF